MNVLVLRAESHRKLHATCFSNGQRKASVLLQQLRGSWLVAGESVLRDVWTTFRRTVGSEPDAVAIWAPYGGPGFSSTAVATPQVVDKLKASAHHAPLHTPAVLSLVERCQRFHPKVPVILVFETAFFADLPSRERLYGLDSETGDILGARRYGYHGILHEAACRQVASQRRKLGTESPPQILSICLDRKPEITAVVGCRPVMVTSGATPLEGLPGETTCGELDPSIVLILAEKMGWGPEQVNTALTQESGLLGLVGARTTLDKLFASDTDDLRLAQDVVRYRMLLACGAGVATMGGLDALVFSGRHVQLGDVLGPWLVSKLALRGQVERNGVLCESFRETLDQVIADSASGAVLGMRSQPHPLAVGAHDGLPDADASQTPPSNGYWR